MHDTAGAPGAPRADQATVASGATSGIVTAVEERTVSPGWDAKSTTSLNVFVVLAALCTLPCATHAPDVEEQSAMITSDRALSAGSNGTVALGASCDVRGTDSFPPEPPLEQPARHRTPTIAELPAAALFQARDLIFPP
jgi:hypothetical protein